ncbi:MAG: single-stranded DNA-binding protein [Acidithiobacillus sp.]|nr:single-stranded DNA-binding protein [Acidithiobacillus sp.]
MHSLNKVELIGHLGRDVELRYSPAGNAFGSVSIATSRRVKGKDGSYQDVTDWHNLVLMGKTAENAAKYLSKGSYVYAEGRLQTRKWTDKEGQDRYTTEIVVYSLGYLEKKDDSDDRGGNTPLPPHDSFEDDDIPFISGANWDMQNAFHVGLKRVRF